MREMRAKTLQLGRKRRHRQCDDLRRRAGRSKKAERASRLICDHRPASASPGRSRPSDEIVAFDVIVDVDLIVDGDV
jgi:hypothetical protein